MHSDAKSNTLDGKNAGTIVKSNVEYFYIRWGLLN
jgi:hypothetical protein